MLRIPPPPPHISSVSPRGSPIFFHPNQGTVCLVSKPQWLQFCEVYHTGLVKVVCLRLCNSVHSPISRLGPPWTPWVPVYNLLDCICPKRANMRARYNDTILDLPAAGCVLLQLMMNFETRPNFIHKLLFLNSVSFNGIFFENRSHQQPKLLAYFWCLDILWPNK